MFKMGVLPATTLVSFFSLWIVTVCEMSDVCEGEARRAEFAEYDDIQHGMVKAHFINKMCNLKC